MKTTSPDLASTSPRRGQYPTTTSPIACCSITGEVARWELFPKAGLKMELDKARSFCLIS